MGQEPSPETTMILITERASIWNDLVNKTLTRVSLLATIFGLQEVSRSEAEKKRELPSFYISLNFKIVIYCPGICDSFS